MILRPDPARPGEPRPRLVLRFALYAGAVLLVAGVTIAWLVNREVADRAQRTVEGQARAVVAANLRSHLRPSDFAAPVTGPRRAQLDRLFRRGVLLPGVVGGRLVSRGGTVTYAAPPARNVKVLRVTVPVRLDRGTRAIGAVELDQDAVAAGVDGAEARLALILALALLALYVSLFPILRRVTRRLERLLAAEQAARAEAEVAQRLLADQNARLRELDGLKDEFISLVSHELRTPLTSIRGYVELLLDDDGLGEEQRRFLAVVDRNSARLLDLVSDLLFLAQVDAGKLAFEVGAVDLEEVVRESVESALPAAAAKGVDVASQVEHLPALDGDRARLAQVLDNLISNAIKFTPAGGRVDVRLAEAGGSAVLKVQDTGLGLAEDEVERLFQRFFRSSRATADAIPGTGLGLTIAKTIVERHGGRIELESALDVGTTVRVELPLSRREVERPRHEIAA